MRSFTYGSVLALALSIVSALPSGALNQRSDHTETIESVDSGYLLDSLEKRHNYPESAKLVEVGYTCGTTFYNNHHIQKTVQKACGKIDSKKLIKPKYPKIYSPKSPGAEFRNVKGNQYVFPILRKGIFACLSKFTNVSKVKRAGRHRVVLNKECKLAGLVVQKKDRTWYTLGLGGKTRFSKCTKVYEKSSL